MHQVAFSPQRFLCLDLRLCLLINVYVPAFGEAAERHRFKQAFHIALHGVVRYLRSLGRQVIVVGDINATVCDLDRCSEPSVRRSSSLPASVPPAVPFGWFRRWFADMLGGRGDGQAPCSPSTQQSRAVDLVDTFRHFHPNKKAAYTCWSTLTAARKTNFGRRLDYTLVSAPLFGQVHGSDVQQDVLGSDHCPVWVMLSAGVYQAQSARDQPWLQAPRGCCPSSVQREAAHSMRGAQDAPGALQSYTPPDSLARDYSDTWLLPSLDAPLHPAPSLEAAAKLHQAPVQSCIGAFFQSTPTAAAAAAHSDTPSPPVGAPPPALVPLQQRRGKRPRSTKLAQYFMGSKQPRADPPGPHSPVHIDLTQDQEEDTVPGEPASTSTAVQGWASLLKGPLPPPLCHHGEPTTQRKVVKPGESIGRSFFVCARPEGAQGDPAARCNFFKWQAQHQRKRRAPTPTSHSSK